MESNRDFVNSFLQLFIVGDPVRMHSFKKFFFTESMRKLNSRRNIGLVSCDKNMTCFLDLIDQLVMNGARKGIVNLRSPLYLDLNLKGR